MAEDELQTDENALVIPDEALAEDHRSGFVAVVGQPNVGKSTLMNGLVGEKIAIATPKPQTTRRRIRGILTRSDAQIIFVDTPGIHKPEDRLGEYMVTWAQEAMPDADLILFLVDASRSPDEMDRLIAERIRASGVPAFLVLNKMDQINPDISVERHASYSALGEWQQVHHIAASRGQNVDALLRGIIEALPPGPRFYPAEQLSDQHERDIVAEMIREQALHQLSQEVPHALDVQVEEFKERDNGLLYVGANIIVERPGQKGIIIGHQGTRLRSIGAAARREIEKFVGRKVYLDLWIKVRPKWREDEKSLRRWGYEPPKK